MSDFPDLNELPEFCPAHQNRGSLPLPASRDLLQARLHLRCHFQYQAFSPHQARRYPPAGFPGSRVCRYICLRSVFLWFRPDKPFSQFWHHPEEEPYDYFLLLLPYTEKSSWTENQGSLPRKDLPDCHKYSEALPPAGSDHPS